MDHLPTDSQFLKPAPAPTPRSSSYTATTILTVTVYGRQVSDEVFAITHGPLSKLSKPRITAVRMADSGFVEEGPDIDPDDHEVDDSGDILHYDDIFTVTRKLGDKKARCTSSGIRYIHKTQDVPYGYYWDWNGKFPKKDECGRSIVRSGESPSEKKFRLQKEFIHNQSIHLGLLLLVVIMIVGALCCLIRILHRQWRPFTTIPGWEEVMTACSSRARLLFGTACASLGAWFTAKREVVEYELRDWVERNPQQTELETTTEQIHNIQRTSVDDQANTQTRSTAAPVYGDDDDKSSQELFDEMASRDDWVREPSTSAPARRLGSVIRRIFRRADDVEIPAESREYESVTLFDHDEVEEEFYFHNFTSQDTLLDTEEVSDEEEAGEDDNLSMSFESDIDGESSNGDVTAEDSSVPIIRIDEAEAEDASIIGDRINREVDRNFLYLHDDRHGIIINFVATEWSYYFPYSNGQDDLIDMDDEADEEADFLLSASTYSTDSEMTLVNPQESREEIILRLLRRQEDVIDMDDESSEEDDHLLDSSMYSEDNQEIFIDSDGTPGQDDFFPRSSTQSIDKEKALVNSDGTLEQDAFTLRSSTPSVDSEETLVNSDETPEESEPLMHSSTHSADSAETLVDREQTPLFSIQISDSEEILADSYEAPEEDDSLLRFSSRSVDDDETSEENDLLMRSLSYSTDSEETLVDNNQIPQSSNYITDSEETLVNHNETLEEDNFSMNSSFHSTNSEETLVDNDGTSEENDLMRSSLHSTDSEETLVDTEQTPRFTIHINDSEETLVNVNETLEEDDFSMTSSVISNDSQETLVGNTDNSSQEYYHILLLIPIPSLDIEPTLDSEATLDSQTTPIDEDESDRISVLSGETLVNTDEDVDNDEDGDDLLRYFTHRIPREQRSRNWWERLHYYRRGD